MKIYLNALFRGVAKNSYSMRTAIDKYTVVGDVYLSLHGLQGDECADKRFHGGLERALHQYPSEHYFYWEDKYNAGITWQQAGMGENLSSVGMNEENVCIGDRFKWGEAIIEVSQPRSPCLKLNKRWKVNDFSIHMQNNGRCGWLYRVIQPGIVNVNEPLVLIERCSTSLTIREVCDIYFGTPLNQDGLKRLLDQNRLSASWKETVECRLKTKAVENWNYRLLGHE